MTFEDFQKTRKTMSAEAFGELVQDAMWEGETETTFLVYQDLYWIEKLDDGRHCLTIENMQWVTGEDVTLEDLERELYQWSLTA